MRAVGGWAVAAVTLAIAASGLIARAGQTTAQSTVEDALTNRARGIHERVLTLDTHNDINPENFTTDRNYTQDLGNQVNLPKMFEGGLDASFFIVYVGQDRTDTAFTPAGYDRAYKQAIDKFDAIHRLTASKSRPTRSVSHSPRLMRGKSTRLDARSPSLVSRTDIRSARISDGSRSSTTAVRAICRWRTTATVSSRTRTLAKPRAGNGTVFRRSANRPLPS